MPDILRTLGEKLMELLVSVEASGSGEKNKPLPVAQRS